MSEKMSISSPQTRRKSLKSYSSKVFKESSVGVVSSIAQTDSLRRRIFKVLAFLLCLTGFLYQSGKYMFYVLQYPTSVDIDVRRPDTYNMPAYTFCDNNGINRRIFCEKFPDRCEEPSESLCKKYASYCGENKTRVPKREYYNFPIDMDLKPLADLNVKRENFAETLIRVDENITSPFLRVKDFTEAVSETYICYSLNDRVNNSLPPRTFTQNKFFREPVNIMRFKVREDEMFLPGKRAGILFALHSPFQSVNPFETGIFMKPGRTYMIYVSVEEEILEKRPYDTDCVNYTEIWENNGHTGPRLQDMCRHNCLSDLSVQCFNCIVPILLFPRQEKFCTNNLTDGNSCPDNVVELAEQCNENCRDDCSQTKFRYTVQERFRAHFDEKGNTIDDIENIIGVEIYFEGNEVLVFKHSPKYMNVEVFSNIGGFIGMWLGMSLLDLTDFFEGLFRIFRYSTKKR